MFGEECCTYIPDNTGVDGKVTVAINKITSLSEELKRNSGIKDPWEEYFSWTKRWKTWLVQIGAAVGAVLILLLLLSICIIPCIRKALGKTVDSATAGLYPLITEEDPSYEYPEGHTLSIKPHTPRLNYRTTQLQ